MREQVYTVAGDPEKGYAGYDLRGELCGAGETFAECVDSIRNRQRSGWLAPGPIFRQMECVTVTLDEQIKCVGREIGMRKNVYPRWVANGKMTQAKADHEIAAMEAVLVTLKGLESKP